MEQQKRIAAAVRKQLRSQGRKPEHIAVMTEEDIAGNVEFHAVAYEGASSVWLYGVMYPSGLVDVIFEQEATQQCAIDDIILS